MSHNLNNFNYSYRGYVLEVTCDCVHIKYDNEYITACRTIEEAKEILDSVLDKTEVINDVH